MRTIIVVYIYLFFFILKFVKLNELNKGLNKEDVLKITNEYYISFFCCKNVTCALVDNLYNILLVEIPDKKGNIITYITYTCTYDNIKSGKCLSEVCAYGSCTSTKCSADSQCLSNKCIDNFFFFCF
ncbi:hypothetical protein U3516DRAFT_839521 [Neocallimastix sp. 'constans']